MLWAVADPLHQPYLNRISCFPPALRRGKHAWSIMRYPTPGRHGEGHHCATEVDAASLTLVGDRAAADALMAHLSSFTAASGG
ncbi:MAG: hypothetical protein GPOALKHO_001680 [Sodalis sp.]|nr:MAG: hypothetical protein GPOALKHO_001680 [Sodalis sp.]